MNKLKLYSLRETAELLGLHYVSLSRPAYRQKIGLRAVQQGCRIKFRECDIQEYLERNLETWPEQPIEEEAHV